MVQRNRSLKLDTLTRKIEKLEKSVKIKELRDEISRYDTEYYLLDSPTVSDDEYDKKKKELKK